MGQQRGAHAGEKLGGGLKVLVDLDAVSDGDVRPLGSRRRGRSGDVDAGTGCCNQRFRTVA